ncbi:hypothetical protein P0C22_06130 [Plesiomonas shigelloides]|uniref:DUF6602 domain-containing protein n=1 Tax=Plesiomonas shigelloides TaxID=703 RepID=UPI0030BA5E14
MNHLFSRKLENIHSNLMEKHRDTQHYSSPIIGAEREAVSKELLSLVLPPNYRIGSGTIVDASGRETGQIDAVIEHPFSLSFPVATDSNRLYLADTVGAAFEIKSNLSVQGKDALNKIKEIRALTRHHVEKEQFVQFDLLQIPCFIIGFTGQTTIDAVEKNFIDPLDSYFPNGVLILESEIFYGRTAEGKWHIAKGKAECIFAFLSCLIKSLRIGARSQIDLDRYVNLLTNDA